MPHPDPPPQPPKNQYLDYKGLKKFLKKQTEDEHGNRRDWDDTDEAQFVRELEMELEKIAGFQDRKVRSLLFLLSPL